MSVDVRRSRDLIRLVIRSEENPTADARVNTAWYETVDLLSRKESLRLIKRLLDTLEEFQSDLGKGQPDVEPELRTERTRANKLDH
jgi:hypothetical protein